MADEKNLDNEFEEEKAVEETVEEAVEETAEEAEVAAEEAEVAAEEAEVAAEEAEVAAEEAEVAAEEAEADAEEAEEAAEGEEAPEEELSEVDKAVAQAMAERDAQEAQKKADKLKKTKMIAIIAAAVIVVGGVIGSGFVSRSASGGIRFNTYSGWLPKSINKYNRGYVNVTDTTIGELADSMGIEVSDFLEEFELPADMPGSTYEMAAIYNLPTKVYCQMYYSDFETIKDLIGIPDKTEDGEAITEDTPWGVALDEVPVGKYISDSGDGAELEKFKEQHGFGDEVTLETKWKEVRDTVDKASRKARRDSAKAASTPAEEDADTAKDAATDAPKATAAAE